MNFKEMNLGNLKGRGTSVSVCQTIVGYIAHAEHALTAFDQIQKERCYKEKPLMIFISQIKSNIGDRRRT